MDKTLAQKILALTKPIQLIALSAIPDDILMTHKRCAALKLAQKHIYKETRTTILFSNRRAWNG